MDAKIRPRLWQANYLIQRALVESVKACSLFIRGLVLDYGCGERPYRSLFSQVNYYIGVDIIGNSLPDVYVGEDPALPFRDNTFDTIVSFQVLEHVPQPEKYCEECYRVLNQDGYLVMSTHGIWPYHAVPEDLHRWTHRGLQRLLEDSGFCVEHLFPLCPGRLAVVQAANIAESIVLRSRWRWLVYLRRLLRTGIALLLGSGVDEEKETWFAIGYLVVGRKPLASVRSDR